MKYSKNTKNIILQQLMFKFGKHDNFFFKNLSLTLHSHTLYFLSGANGVGKSTLFRILKGDLQPGQEVYGLFTIDGKQYQAHNNQIPQAFCNQVKVVQQDVNAMVIDQFTVQQNLQMACMGVYPGLQPLPHERVMNDLITRFAIDLQAPVGRLSGGQRQIVAILMMLQKPTQLLLLDEPTAALDPANADMVMQCLKQLADQLEITILIITHDNDICALYGRGTTLHMHMASDGAREIVMYDEIELIV